MEIIQVIIIVFALFALSRAFLRFKDNKLSVRDFIFWIVLWGAVIIISFIPSLISYASALLGMGRGLDMMVYLGIIVLFYLIFRLYVKIENQEKEITRLVRNISIEKASKGKDNKDKKRK